MLLDGDPVMSLVDYADRAGLRLAALERHGADWVIEELGRSGLRGRGGAGFPAAIKWRSIQSGGTAAGQRFVVANGAEGEPGTYKDRAILRHDPYALVEGVIVAARALAGEVQIELVQGPDEYLFGEEKALLEVIEGEEPLRSAELRQPARGLEITKIVRLSGDRFDLDESQARKQLDWTYRPG